MKVDFQSPVVAAGAAGLGEFFETRQVSPVDALGAYFARIKLLNPQLNAFLELDEAGAVRDARASGERWAAGAQLSPLDGVPVAVKANIAVAGLHWHGGIAAYADRVAAVDARCVADLRRAGAVILGILNMDEAALGATNDNLAFGRCYNPYRPGYTPGGSAAAVAAGLCAAALGTDTLGSVRIPAGFCGIFGHKPMHGLIPMDGLMPLSRTLDDAGVLARSTRDLSAVMNILKPAITGFGPLSSPRHASECWHPRLSNGFSAAPDESKPKPPGITASAAPLVKPPQIRCGVMDLTGCAGLDPAVSSAFATTVNAAVAAGWQVEALRLDGWDAPAVRRLALLIVEVEALAVHQAMLSRDPRGFSPQLTGMLNWATRRPPAKIAQAYQDLEAAAAALQRVFSRFDAILTPTTPSPAFDFATPPPAGLPDFTLLANLAGWPATAFPMGLSQDGLPLSAQIIAADDRLTIRLARILANPISPPAAFR
jgi:aspartyl-tRNA(Asn)/glutamyl-tRNA(Gln) amidotransferase subunit A